MDDFSLSFEREVEATPTALYRGWTEADLLVQWLTPKPWVTKWAKVEPVPGGAFENIMESPEGQEMPKGAGCVLVADPAKRFVWTSTMRAGFIPNEAPEGGWLMTAQIDFEARGKGTLYRASVYHANAKARDTHAAMGFEAGWGAALDQLVELMREK